MKALTALLTVVVAMWFCAPAQAQAQRERERLGERLQDLSLTDEQEAKIADIRKECRPEVEKAAKELAAVAQEELDKIRKILTPEQQQKLRAFAEERREHRVEGLCARVAHLRELDLTEGEAAKIQEIRKEFRPRIEKALEGLHGTLSAEQKQAREEALRAGKRRREVLAAMKLTDEQKQKAQAVGKEVAALVREELGQVRDVLTAEQKAQIQEVRKEYRPKVHEAGNKFRAAVRDEVTQVLAVIKG